MHLVESDPSLFQKVMDTEIFNWAKHTKNFNISRFNKYEVLYGDHFDWRVNKPIRYSTKNFLSRAQYGQSTKSRISKVIKKSEMNGSQTSSWWCCK